MTIRKTESQIIVDAVTAMVIAMLFDTEDEYVTENSIIGLSPATLFRDELNDRLAWICVHPGKVCPQVFLANGSECDLIDAPFDSTGIDEGPQILSPRFQRENTEDGVHGFNMDHDRFSDAVSEASKAIVRWLVEGRRG